MPSNLKPSHKRRDVLKYLGAAGGVAATGSVAALIKRSDSVGVSLAKANALNAKAPTRVDDLNRFDPKAEPSADVLAFFGDLRPGAQIGRWRIEAIHAVKMGAIPVVLSSINGTDRFQVDVVKRDGEVAGVGNTRSVSVFLLNGGDGSHATREEQGLGAMALADALSARERAGAQTPELLTLAQRNRRFPRGTFRVLV